MSDAPPVRTLREGRYAIIGELGAGSQAETLDAVDKQGGRAVAIKRFQVRGAKSWKDVELAEREARVLSTLSHPNLPVYVEHFEEDGALYLVMEKIDGETLSALRRRKALLSSEDIARFLSDAEQVLGYLHSRAPAIIHRDIKPGNVIRRADGSFAFVDFGSVRDQLKPEGGSTVVGTFGYMAPEQFQGRALPGSDVYAVGATALSLVTGREPEDLPHRGLGIDVPAALGAGAEPWLVRALSAMLEPDPDKRPTRVQTPRPRSTSTSGSTDASGETRGERRERERAERRRERSTGASDWQSAAPDWQGFDPADFRRDLRQKLKSQKRRLQRDINAQIREETRRVRREARDFQRAGRHGWQPHSHGFGPLAPLIVAVVTLALLAARVATWALFRAFLPILLGFLSIFFGSGLRRAAWHCRDVGIAGDAGLQQAMQAVRARILGRADELEVEAETLESDAEVVDEGDQQSPLDSRARTRVPSERVRVESVPPPTPESEPDARENEATESQRARR